MLATLAFASIEQPVAPCGLIAPLSRLRRAEAHARAKTGLWALQVGNSVILYHPEATAPDLPWLDGASYLTRYAPRLYGPAGRRLTLPDALIPRLQGHIAQHFGIDGPVALLPDLSLCDLSPAQPLDQVDLEAVEALAR
ncbi:MAG: hypothetical protein AAGG54_10425 [Pseudomonadota bacterium]